MKARGLSRADPSFCILHSSFCILKNPDRREYALNPAWTVMMCHMSDRQSPLAGTIINANPDAYSALVVHGGASAVAVELLKNVQPSQLLNGPIASPDAAAGMLAGLWVWHDGLDESHRISQKIETPDGSYWHAIMHRREGDFSNSKYWLARCRHHSTTKAIAEELPGIIAGRSNDPAVARLSANGWDPAA